MNCIRCAVGKDEAVACMCQSPKPPIGLKPRFIHDEERLVQVRSAIDRYMKANMRVPVEWIEEHNELTGRLIPQHNKK